MLTRAFAVLKKRLGLLARAGGEAVWDGGPGACVALVDRAGRLRDLSDGAAPVLGAPRARLIGRDFTSLFRSEDRPAVERALSLGGAAGRIVCALAEPAPEGAPRRVEVATSLRADGSRAALILDRNEEIEEAAALRAEAEAARREAKERADLLADLSHEMRTPLNAVIGFAEAMNEETYGPLGHAKYAEYARHIRASGGHLLDLVSSILDLAKIEADRFSLKRERTDVGALVEECAGMVRLAAERAGLALDVEIEEELPESFLDPRAVRQILLNLLSNAVKFTSDGGVTLKALREGDEIVLVVRDTGVGMSKAELAKLGARFTAAHGDGVRGAKGAGLGLALAFALAELHGGSMKLDSAPGEGVTARVRLPIAAPAAPARVRRLSSGRGEEADAHARKPAILTQLERIEAYRRERASAA
ncbi:sensor histidine kinase [Amphiplicatus metriothermophilus]|uniref:histidine kinase n=1 Tax=Amphiplicatus metriothermophilus TaxID=1519374 RepID=A0A239PZ09_9PROT|nr:PAS domain-containing sensor histidine kinase [Amphiplicatus metriothermophilus]MBB5518264.1 cell cycle sensor histidine kinase DivJ [Amphiplicatus metriothermophilus]SNT75494.1 two-component system, cell cycle sensor histidine kinase DivJ [Amphiplicatus metriothermophilus]